MATTPAQMGEINNLAKAKQLAAEQLKHARALVEAAHPTAGATVTEPLVAAALQAIALNFQTLTLSSVVATSNSPYARKI